MEAVVWKGKGAQRHRVVEQVSALFPLPGGLTLICGTRALLATVLSICLLRCVA